MIPFSILDLIYGLVGLSVIISPLIAYLIEGYEQKNTKRGLKYVVVFLSLITIVIILLRLFLMYFVCSIPVLLTLCIIFSNKKISFTN